MTIAQTDIAELTLKSDDFELTVRKAVSFDTASLSGTGSQPSGVVGMALSANVPTAPPVVPGNGIETTLRGGDNGGSGSTPGATIPAPKEQKSVEVMSPMVGTFYRAPAPGEPSFVEVGDRVRIGQPVCIIEAMKLMNEIEAEVSGQVMEILVQNGEPVEYGQPLMRVKPD